MSLNVSSAGFSQTRLPMNLSERSLLGVSGTNGASKAGLSTASVSTTSVQAPVSKPTPRFRTLTPPPATPAPKPASAPMARNPYQARATNTQHEAFAIVADSTPDEGVFMPANATLATPPHPMAERIKDIQKMASQLGYVELSEGAITKAIQNRSSLLANYVV